MHYRCFNCETVSQVDVQTHPQYTPTRLVGSITGAFSSLVPILCIPFQCFYESHFSTFGWHFKHQNYNRVLVFKNFGGLSFPTFLKHVKHRPICHENKNNGLQRCLFAQTIGVPCKYQLNTHPKHQSYNRVLVFQHLGILVFQIFGNVPDTGLVAMTTKTTDHRDVSLPKQ